MVFFEVSQLRGLERGLWPPRELGRPGSVVCLLRVAHVLVRAGEVLLQELTDPPTLRAFCGFQFVRVHIPAHFLLFFFFFKFI